MSTEKTNSAGVEILPDSPNHLLTGQKSMRRDNISFFSQKPGQESVEKGKQEVSSKQAT